MSNYFINEEDNSINYDFPRDFFQHYLYQIPIVMH